MPIRPATTAICWPPTAGAGWQSHGPGADGSLRRIMPRLHCLVEWLPSETLVSRLVARGISFLTCPIRFAARHGTAAPIPAFSFPSGGEFLKLAGPLLSHERRDRQFLPGRDECWPPAAEIPGSRRGQLGKGLKARAAQQSLRAGREVAFKHVLEQPSRLGIPHDTGRVFGEA